MLPGKERTATMGQSCEKGVMVSHQLHCDLSGNNSQDCAYLCMREEALRPPRADPQRQLSTETLVSEFW